jgi:hypothetical protein
MVRQRLASSMLQEPYATLRSRRIGVFRIQVQRAQMGQTKLRWLPLSIDQGINHHVSEQPRADWESPTSRNRKNTHDSQDHKSHFRALFPAQTPPARNSMTTHLHRGAVDRCSTSETPSSEPGKRHVQRLSEPPPISRQRRSDEAA